MLAVETRYERDGDVGVVSLRGEFDVTSAGEAEEALRAAGTAAPRLVIDLSECDFIDSTGLATIVHVSRDLRERGRPLRVASAEGSEVRRLLELTGIGLAVDVVASVDEAIAADEQAD